VTGDKDEMVRRLLNRVPRCGMTYLSSTDSETDNENSAVDSSSRHISRDQTNEEREAANRGSKESEQDPTERRHFEVDLLQQDVEELLVSLINCSISPC
jgi:hypothetical protein